VWERAPWPVTAPWVVKVLYFRLCFSPGRGVRGAERVRQVLPVGDRRTDAILRVHHHAAPVQDAGLLLEVGKHQAHPLRQGVSIWWPSTRPWRTIAPSTSREWPHHASAPPPPQAQQDHGRRLRLVVPELVVNVIVQRKLVLPELGADATHLLHFYCCGSSGRTATRIVIHSWQLFQPVLPAQNVSMCIVTEESVLNTLVTTRKTDSNP
jgi:hypothetical protein